jgi:eukaryotic-like serine/threonine-protein kinase
MTLCINPRCQDPKNSDSVQFCQSCGSELLLELKYRAIRVLGGGGFGKTYEVSAQGKRKVLKVLINNSPKAVELFKREAEVLSQLNHPSIPMVEPNSYFVFHPANSQELVHCLVMELVEGQNLKEYLSQRGRPIDSESAMRWLTELLQILQQVHDRGILHRDIKPQNIILKPDGKLALIDFGAVREGTGTEFATAAASGGGTEVASHMAGGTSVVSAGYTAPEQMNGQAIKQSDLYSLGRTFIFLLTGKEPSQITYDAYSDVLKWRQYAPGVDSRLADLLDRMQSSSVRQRPENTQAVLRDLNPSREASQVEDIEVKLSITPQEAEQGGYKQVTFYRTVYPNEGNSSPKQEIKALTVNIPANSKSGSRLRLKGQGNQEINGSSFGNVYVCLRIDVNINPRNDDVQPMPRAVFAGFGNRSIAFVIDILIICIIYAIILYFVPNPSFVYAALISMIGLFSQSESSKDRATTGKKIAGICVVSSQGNKISFWRAFIRNFIKILSIICFGIGAIYFLLSMLLSKKKQALHDLVAGTVVVQLNN